uniref:Uncharacterized protein n=1 Tax=Glossina brevipalpis TaxID=37001 RepID=A0A1A9VZL3_9MUSC
MEVIKKDFGRMKISTRNDLKDCTVKNPARDEIIFGFVAGVKECVYYLSDANVKFINSPKTKKIFLFKVCYGVLSDIKLGKDVFIIITYFIIFTISSQIVCIVIIKTK